jgi:hypothetical protein
VAQNSVTLRILETIYWKILRRPDLIREQPPKPPAPSRAGAGGPVPVPVSSVPLSANMHVYIPNIDVLAAEFHVAPSNEHVQAVWSIFEQHIVTKTTTTTTAAAAAAAANAAASAAAAKSARKSGRDRGSSRGTGGGAAPSTVPTAGTVTSVVSTSRVNLLMLVFCISSAVK